MKIKRKKDEKTENEHNGEKKKMKNSVLKKKISSDYLVTPKHSVGCNNILPSCGQHKWHHLSHNCFPLFHSHDSLETPHLRQSHPSNITTPPGFEIYLRDHGTLVRPDEAGSEKVLERVDIAVRGHGYRVFLRQESGHGRKIHCSPPTVRVEGRG